MAKYDKDTDWLAKEKRELMCKCVNTLFMSQDPKTQLKPLVDLLLIAKQVVDTAFENYPDKEEYIDADSGETIEEVIK